MIVQDSGSRFTMVVQCKGINYDLMSEIEQLSVEEGFISFLNTLKFPIQLYVQARAVDLRESVRMFKEKVNQLEVKVDDAALEFKRVAESEELDRDSMYDAQLNYERMNNMYEYASDITRYVERMSMNKHMLQRKFYIIFSYDKSEINSSNHFSATELREICYRELFTRAQSIIGALASCSVTGKILDSNELAELLYVSYNRDDEKIIDVKQALESGFHRLYSTSRDVKEKKDELLRKELALESDARISQVIEEAASKSTIEQVANEASERDEKVDRLAIKMIGEAGLDLEVKEALTKLIVKKHLEREEQRRTPKETLKMAKEVSKEQAKVYATVVDNPTIPKTEAQQMEQKVAEQAQEKLQQHMVQEENNVKPAQAAVQVQPNVQKPAQAAAQVQSNVQKPMQAAAQVQPNAQKPAQAAAPVQPVNTQGNILRENTNNTVPVGNVKDFVDKSLIN